MSVAKQPLRHELMTDPGEMTRSELEVRVSELENENRELKQILSQVLDSDPELRSKIDIKEAEKALDNLEKDAKEAIERMDEVGHW